MTAWNINGSIDGYSYFGDPRVNYGGPHLWQHCQNISENGWCAPSQSLSEILAIYVVVKMTIEIFVKKKDDH